MSPSVGYARHDNHWRHTVDHHRHGSLTAKLPKMSRARTRSVVGPSTVANSRNRCQTPQFDYRVCTGR